MRRVVTLLVCLSLASTTLADVPMKDSHCVPNRKPGYCMWCSIEMIGKYKHDERLKGLVDWYQAQYLKVPGGGQVGATTEDVKNCLDNLDVDYIICEHMTLAQLKHKTDAGIPIVVCSNTHAVVACDVEGEWIKVVDPNRIKVWSYVHKSWWIGWALEIK